MKAKTTVVVSVDGIYTTINAKVNFTQPVEGYLYFNENSSLRATGERVAKNIACIRARKAINELSSFRAVSAKVLLSTTLGWKNNN